jgi:hypothetical protein
MSTDRDFAPYIDADGNFIHPCCVCGADAYRGFGVSLLHNKLGTWYCGKCLAQRDQDQSDER